MAKISKTIFIGFLFLAFPFFVRAENIEFNIDSSFDNSGRSKVSAFLHQVGQNGYFFVEEDYYKNLDIEQITEFSQNLRNLAREFDENIYPNLTKIFGSEWKPGIDKDERITVLLTQIKGDSGGYFNSGDEYPRIESFRSNEREMIYLNVKYLRDPLAKSFLAHEFTHLITFNQKEKRLGVSEDVWLNEARAEIAPTLLGYDDVYQGSNLQKRVRTFSSKPGDSLTEWKNTSSDYGVINIFSQYLLDHYSHNVFIDSLRSGKTGIASLNEALKKNGYTKNFSQIFSDWLVAVLVNDCDFSSDFCFFNPNLKNLKILPQLNYLPQGKETALRVVDFTKDWSGAWFKFVGGKGTLKLEFVGEEKAKFKVPYLGQDSSGVYSLSFLELDNVQRGTVFIPDFTKKYVSLIIIPFVGEKISGFGDIEPFYQFMWQASIVSDNSDGGEDELINQLLAQIEILKKKILEAQAQIAALLAQKPPLPAVCGKLAKDLSMGMQNNEEVRCLQKFLAGQGKDIYPEALITGNFFSLTQTAVIRFQEKYRAEILTPVGLKSGTGFVGPQTRAKINSMM